MPWQKKTHFCHILIHAYGYTFHNCYSLVGIKTLLSHNCSPFTLA